MKYAFYPSVHVWHLRANSRNCNAVDCNHLQKCKFARLRHASLGMMCSDLNELAVIVLGYAWKELCRQAAVKAFGTSVWYKREVRSEVPLQPERHYSRQAFQEQRKQAPSQQGLENGRHNKGRPKQLQKRSNFSGGV